MPRIEIVATDGKSQKRVAWIHQTKNGVYLGFCKENKDVHISYHADGNVFRTEDGKKEKLATFQSFKDFKGKHQLAALWFSSDLSALQEVPIYKMEKLDAVIYIDARQFIKSGKGIGCMIFLLEPGRFDLLNSLAESPPSITEIHVFLEFKPWLVVAIYKG